MRQGRVFPAHFELNSNDTLRACETIFVKMETKCGSADHSYYSSGKMPEPYVIMRVSLLLLRCCRTVTCMANFLLEISSASSPRPAPNPLFWKERMGKTWLFSIWEMCSNAVLIFGIKSSDESPLLSKIISNFLWIPLWKTKPFTEIFLDKRWASFP